MSCVADQRGNDRAGRQRLTREGTTDKVLENLQTDFNEASEIDGCKLSDRLPSFTYRSQADDTDEDLPYVAFAIV